MHLHTPTQVNTVQSDFFVASVGGGEGGAKGDGHMDRHKDTYKQANTHIPGGGQGKSQEGWDAHIIIHAHTRTHARYSREQERPARHPGLHSRALCDEA